LTKYSIDTVISGYQARLKKAMTGKDSGEFTLTIKLMDGGIRDVESIEKLKVKAVSK